MNTTPTDDGAFSEKNRFDSSLGGVAEQLGVPLSTVRSWRDDLECPFLRKRPYDISAVRQWLNEQVRAVIDPNSEIERRKLELEVRKLERENRVFSRDKVYWLAVAAAGIAISSEIRQWIKESRATHETDPLPEEKNLAQADYQDAKHELAFLLEVLTQTISDLVGRGAGILGYEAGRVGAKQMPLYMEENSGLEEVLRELQKSLAGGWKFDFRLSGGSHGVLTFGDCIVRKICQAESWEMGGDICRFFHTYLGGMLREFVGDAFSVEILETGQKCKTKVHVR